MGLSDTPLAPENFRPELVVGFVGPLGSNLTELIHATQGELRRLGYHHCRVVKVSSSFPWATPDEDSPVRETVSLADWYTRNMELGDQIRERTRERAGAVLGVIRLIAEHRRNLTRIPSGLAPSRDTAYLIDSLKTPEEILLLRAIYGPWFVLIAAHCPRDLRIENLAKRINGRTAKARRDEATKLIDRDEQGEALRPYGQNVREAFALADVIVRTEKRDPKNTGDSLQESLKRFFDLLFQRGVHTPTRDEQGMFLAHAASLRSSSLSRQVGAAICSEDGQVDALGTNEAPKFQGGAYWEETTNGSGKDGRTRYQLDGDPAQKMRQEMLMSIFERFQQAQFPLPDVLQDKSLQEQVEWFNHWQADQEQAGVRARTLIDDTIEHNREVHAELLALTDLARRGVSSQNRVLYTTTFPCHDCAKHIVAGGLARVVFLEPYAKSLVREFYKDSIHIEGDENSSGQHVEFDNFVGVAPKRYATLFRLGRRRTEDENEEASDPEAVHLRLSDYGDSYDVRPASTLTTAALVAEVLVYQALKATLEEKIQRSLEPLPGLRHDLARIAPADVYGLVIQGYGKTPPPDGTSEPERVQPSGNSARDELPLFQQEAASERATAQEVLATGQREYFFQAIDDLVFEFNRYDGPTPTYKDFARLLRDTGLMAARLQGTLPKWVKNELGAPGSSGQERDTKS